MQLVGGLEKIDLFIILGVFLFKVLSTFIMRCYHWHFPGEFNAKENYGAIRKLSALRVPGGNQVDGLPPARHTVAGCS